MFFSDLIPTSLKINKDLIPTLQKPLGKFFKVDNKLTSPEKRVIEFIRSFNKYIFVVGDFVADSLLKENFIPDLIIVDEKTQRNQSYQVSLPEKYEIIEVKNDPGEISKSSWEIIRILLATQFAEPPSKYNPEKVLKVIKVKGEEDLLALPLILDAPLNSIVLYGYPPMLTGEQGIILIEVTMEIKKKIETILLKFDQT